MRNALIKLNHSFNIHSMLLYICSVKYHKRRQNVIRMKQWRTRLSRVCCYTKALSLKTNALSARAGKHWD